MDEPFYLPSTSPAESVVSTEPCTPVASAAVTTQLFDTRHASPVVKYDLPAAAYPAPGLKLEPQSLGKLVGILEGRQGRATSLPAGTVGDYVEKAGGQAAMSLSPVASSRVSMPYGKEVRLQTRGTAFPALNPTPIDSSLDKFDNRFNSPSQLQVKEATIRATPSAHADGSTDLEASFGREMDGSCQKPAGQGSRMATSLQSLKTAISQPTLLRDSEPSKAGVKRPTWSSEQAGRKRRRIQRNTATLG